MSPPQVEPVDECIVQQWFTECDLWKSGGRGSLSSFQGVPKIQTIFITVLRDYIFFTLLSGAKAVMANAVHSLGRVEVGAPYCASSHCMFSVHIQLKVLDEAVKMLILLNLGP